MTPNRNVLWARVIADELLRQGVRHALLCPGSRNAPLILALCESERFTVTSHVDERSAGYFAVGIARATGLPPVVVTTSGTAVANLHPAVAEAFNARLPLIVLSADRPSELLGTGANQTLEHAGLFRPHVKADVSLDHPEPTGGAVETLRESVSRAALCARDWPPGPVHVNVPMREPLHPAHVAGDVLPDWFGNSRLAAGGRENGAPFAETSPMLPSASTGSITTVAQAIQDATRGVIVCGPRDGDGAFRGAVLDLAEATGFPVLADALSGLRFGRHRGKATVVSAYDSAFSRASVRERFVADLVLRFGNAPTSKALTTWLSEQSTARQFLIDEAGREREETGRVQHVIHAEASGFCRQLARRLPAKPDGPTQWALQWSAMSEAAQGALSRAEAADPSEAGVVARVLESLVDDDILVIGNSLPVRDLERNGFARGRDVTVYANRGVSGIDGVTSTAAGIQFATGRPTVVVLGDLSFLHDLSGFAAVAQRGTPLDVVVINNDGGGIFQTMPIKKQDPTFTQFIATPHGMSIQKIAQGFGVAASRVRLDEFSRTEYVRLRPGLGPRVTEVMSDRVRNAKRRQAAQEAAADAAGAELEVKNRAR